MATTLDAAGGLSARFAAAGTLHLAWGEPDWLGPGGLTVTLHGAVHAAAVRVGAPSGGADDLGPFDAVALAWPGLPLPLAGTLRAYRQQALLVLRLAAPEGFADAGSGAFATPLAAWHFDLPARAAGGAPDGLRTYGHQWAEFALPVFGDAEAQGFLFAPHRAPVVTPLLLLAPDGRTLLLAPLDQFHEQVIAAPHDGSSGVRCGWHGDLAEAPAGFASELALWAAPAPRAALDAWAALLRRRAGTTRPSRYADAGLARLSYWTDNGATYYYRTAPGRDCTETLVAAVEDCEARGLPIALVQVDSWFYPHEQLRPVGDAGAPIVPPTGLMRWEPRRDLFPDGFADLRRRLGHRPLAFHSRHFAAASPYFARHPAWVDGAYAHPQGEALLDELLAAAADWGAITYEQDWLVESFAGVRGLRAAPGRARAWQEGLDRAAAAHGLTLQWCMATPADFLQSVTLRHLTSIRTSGDYRYLFDNGLNWVWFLHVNALARALGLNAFKDVFLSDRAAEPYAEVEALLAALSAGPVGIGDAIGRADRDLVLRTCREDGVLVKPDAPLAAIDRCFQRHGHLTPALLIGETFSAHGAQRWHYVTTLHASSTRQRLGDRVARAELPEAGAGPALLYDWRRRRIEPLDSGGWAVELDFQDWDYRVVCPLLPGERTLIGDPRRYATMGDRRVSGVAAAAEALAFDVHGMPGTIAEIHGWSAAPPAAVRASTYEGERELALGADGPDTVGIEADGRWAVRVAIDLAGRVRVTVR